MEYQPVQSPEAAASAWALARRQHGVVSRGQLRALGFHPQAIKRRLVRGRLHRTRWRGVYAVGRPELTRYGTWMAAVLACAEGAFLSHRSAASLWQMGSVRHTAIEVSVPDTRRPRASGVTVHRRARIRPSEVTTRYEIPVTTPAQTLIDLATCSSPGALEAAVNDADKLDLIDPETLRSVLDEHVGEPGVRILRNLLDRRTFTLTDSELERRFLPLARRAGLPMPLTQQWLNGFRVDFHWPDLGLVVETDGLRYHRTPAQQAADRRRDQAQAAAGLIPLRFSHSQVAFEPGSVEATLSRVAHRLAEESRSPQAGARASSDAAR
jgi:very-short-patch-repair endonuclease